MDDLIHDAQLIERTGASVLFGQRPQQIPLAFDNGLSRFVVWFIKHTLTIGSENFSLVNESLYLWQGEPTIVIPI